MRVEGKVHCEAPGCKTSAHMTGDLIETMGLPTGWLQVEEFARINKFYAFCSHDCVMKWAAGFEPPTVISASSEPS